jgi:steroid delta-isomerase-like uncharacterized protein
MANPRDVTARILDRLNARDVDGIQRYVADTVRYSNPITGPTDRQGMAEFHGALFTALPDIHYHVERTIAQGDTIVLECNVTGTNRGPFMGRPPTGRRAELPVVFVMNVSGDQVSEWRSYFDVATMQRHLAPAEETQEVTA